MRNIKIISLMLLSILIFSGCSVNKSTEVDKATQQKNITKLQNNVNEVIGKKYSEVRFNLGKPYATTYYVNLDNYNEVNDINLNELEENLNAQLIYPKEGYESSALYVQVSKNEVINVRTDSFVGTAPGTNSIPEYIDKYHIVIDFYENVKEIDELKIEETALNNYINKDLDLLNTELGISSPNIIVHDKNKTINIYPIKNSQEFTDSALIVDESNNKINKISIQNGKNIINNIIKDFK